MFKAEFTVPGLPKGKARPRATFINGKARLYTPKTTVEFEGAVRKAAAPHFQTPIDGPVKLNIVAYFPMPKSWSKRRRAEMDGKHHTKKPDKDNVEKAICDGLNGTAWVDDCLVADGRTVKRWANFAGTFVRIEEIVD